MTLPRLEWPSKLLVNAHCEPLILNGLSEKLQVVVFARVLAYLAKFNEGENRKLTLVL